MIVRTEQPTWYGYLQRIPDERIPNTSVNINTNTTREK